MDEKYPQLEWSDIWNSEAHTDLADDNHTRNGPRRLLKETQGSGSDSGESDDLQSGRRYGSLEGPATQIWYPVFSSLEGNRTVVAVLSMSLRWDSFILPNMPPDPNGILVVIGNSCNQEFTFALTDNDVIYLGDGDLHEAKYESLKWEFSYTSKKSPITGVSFSDDYCPYKVTAYPSAKMEDRFLSNEPAVSAGGVAIIFLFTLMVFLIYDFLVERRQRFLADTASKSSAIVTALFPQIVRDRMFETEDKNTKHRGLRSSAVESSMDPVSSHSARGGAPIANLFANATVMFGDIAGFTAWSSSREPVDVFTLLET
eukprot:scaffold11607_cov88-Cylindrotheca_fusiformis.AAC.2